VTDKPALFGWLIVILLWGASVSLLGVLSASASMELSGSSSVAAQLLGSTRVALAEYAFYEKADSVYHRGGSHYRETAITNTLFQSMQAALIHKPGSHLAGDQIGEILPWLRLSMSLDPHNIEAGLVAAHWVESGLARPDIAMEILSEMEAANPRSYMAQVGKGRLYAKLGDRDHTRLAFSRALKLWPSDEDPEDRGVLLNKREILVHLSVLKELEGDLEGAIMDLKQIVVMFPDNTTRGFLDRIAALEQGRDPKEPALHRWDLQRSRKYYSLCDE
jgi:tetratricopeptide (TPR) repeat protein